MSFPLIDRIVALEAGSSITAVKSPSLSEEYLQDHFPQFPVMPGVLMLEAMYQAAAWLIRATDDFSHSVVLLKEARNVRYSGFVRPGETLRVSAQIQKREDCQTTIKAIGQIGDKKVVSARLVLLQRNLADDNPDHATIDGILVGRQKHDFCMLYSATPDVSA
jgi:3-hydroxyacyl-[acyl-carrier-protein] dehydratase